MASISDNPNNSLNGVFNNLKGSPGTSSSLDKSIYSPNLLFCISETVFPLFL